MLWKCARQTKKEPFKIWGISVCVQIRLHALSAGCWPDGMISSRAACETDRSRYRCPAFDAFEQSSPRLNLGKNPIPGRNHQITKGSHRVWQRVPEGVRGVGAGRQEQPGA